MLSAAGAVDKGSVAKGPAPLISQMLILAALSTHACTQETSFPLAKVLNQIEYLTHVIKHNLFRPRLFLILMS